jgi:hypothetical protein
MRKVFSTIVWKLLGECFLGDLFAVGPPLAEMLSGKEPYASVGKIAEGNTSILSPFGTSLADLLGHF